MSRGIWRRSLKFSRSLTHFMSLVLFSAPRMHEKTSGFVYECCEIFIFGTDFLFLVLAWGSFVWFRNIWSVRAFAFLHQSVCATLWQQFRPPIHLAFFSETVHQVCLFFCLLVFCKLIDKFPRLINGKRGYQTVNKFLQRFR